MLKTIKTLVFNRLGFSVTYGDEFFDSVWFHNWTKLKNVLSELILTVPNWKRVLDFGCGPGIMIDHMNQLGVDYHGLEYSNEASELYRLKFGQFPHHYHRALRDLPNINFSLFLAFDVFEHMKDMKIEQILKSVSSIPDLLVNISRARTLPGHINIKSDKNWVTFFERRGYLLNVNYTNQLRKEYLKLCPRGEDLWHENLFVFSKISK